MRQRRDFVIHLASAQAPAVHRHLVFLGVAMVAAAGTLAFALSV